MSETEEVESAYQVPNHLNTAGSIGLIPDRAFYVGLAALTLAALPAYIGYETWGYSGITLGIIPLLLSLPFGAWWLNPAFEHGLMHWLAFRFSRKTLLPQHLASLKDVRIEGNTIVIKDGYRAIIALPTLNLDLASGATKRRHRRQMGLLFDGISTHAFQLMVRAEVQQHSTALERMRLHRNPFSRKLADWLAEHHQQQEAIDRRRYLIIPAESFDTLNDRVETISRSLRQAGLDAQRVDDPSDIRDLLNSWWTWRPHAERLGPETIIQSANELQVDGEFITVYTLSKLPSTITTNWWFQLLDRDLPVDMVMTCEQQDLTLAKWRMDLKYNNLFSSNPSPSRHIAIEQVRALRMAFENRVRPWNVQILFIVRGHDQKTRDRYAKRLIQQMKDLGGIVQPLKWEHYQGMVSAQPLCGLRMPNRALYLESGTLARTTPLGASTLQMRDGVPWGLSGSTPILLTTKGMRTGRHFGWFGYTGCIAPETVLQTPDGDFKVSEINRPFRVWALSADGQPAVAWAETPYVKGTADLYRVKLHSGRAVCATLQHRVLTPDGWRKLEDVCAGTQIAVAANISQTKDGRSDRVASDQHFERTRVDSLVHYSAHSHLGDQPLHQEVDNGLESVLQSVDVRVHNPHWSHMDDLKPLPEYNHAYRQYDHRSRNNSYSLPNHGRVRQFLNAITNSVLPLQNTGNDLLLWQVNHRSNIDRLSLATEVSFAYSAVERLSRSNGALDSLDYDTITSISFERRDVYYDLHVPKYENYLAEGIWHHNSGKGFGVRCYLARRYFADRLRVFMWDADDAQHEYAGRFTEFLQGIRLELNTLEDVSRIQIDPLWQVIAFDVSGMPREDQPQAFAKIKRLVEEHVLAFPGETAFLVDEAVTLAEAKDQSGAMALGEAIQTWRKRGIECHVITQRVSDWFGTPIGRKIQGNLAVKWYGAQEDSELYEIARRVNLSDEERDRIGAAGIGQGILVAFGRRVFSDLFDHTSSFEYEVYSTDPPERVEVLASRRIA